MNANKRREEQGLPPSNAGMPAGREPELMKANPIKQINAGDRVVPVREGLGQMKNIVVIGPSEPDNMKAKGSAYFHNDTTIISTHYEAHVEAATLISNYLYEKFRFAETLGIVYGSVRFNMDLDGPERVFTIEGRESEANPMKVASSRRTRSQKREHQIQHKQGGFPIEVVGI